MAFDRRALDIDAARETERITGWLRETVHRELRRKGAVVGLSGGVDSSTVLALCVRAFGRESVIGILMPERESNPDSVRLGQKVAGAYGVETLVEDLTPALQGLDGYRRRDEAIARLFPAFTPEWKAKMTLPGNLLQQDTLNVFSLTVISPDGQSFSQRLPLREYQEIVAAQNFKQRTRMVMLYHHAERRNYAVVGTANKNEHDLGFFVKYGDGGVDVQPIAHLFKTQVYQLATYLDVPPEIRAQASTTDTYSAGGTQQEFFFRVPFEIQDLVWLGHDRGIASEDIAAALGLSVEQVERVVHDIIRKQRTTAYLRRFPVHLDAEAQDRASDEV